MVNIELHKRNIIVTEKGRENISHLIDGEKKNGLLLLRDIDVTVFYYGRRKLTLFYRDLPTNIISANGQYTTYYLRDNVYLYHVKVLDLND